MPFETKKNNGSCYKEEVFENCLVRLDREKNKMRCFKNAWSVRINDTGKHKYSSLFMDETKSCPWDYYMIRSESHWYCISRDAALLHKEREIAWEESPIKFGREAFDPQVFIYPQWWTISTAEAGPRLPQVVPQLFVTVPPLPPVNIAGLLIFCRPFIDDLKKDIKKNG